jgi:hypothetical protein
VKKRRSNRPVPVYHPSAAAEIRRFAGSIIHGLGDDIRDLGHGAADYTRRVLEGDEPPA